MLPFLLQEPILIRGPEIFGRAEDLVLAGSGGATGSISRSSPRAFREESWALRNLHTPFIYIYIYTYTYIYIYSCMCTYIDVHIYIYVYIIFTCIHHRHHHHDRDDHQHDTCTAPVCGGIGADGLRLSQVPKLAGAVFCEVQPPFFVLGRV